MDKKNIKNQEDNKNSNSLTDDNIFDEFTSGKNKELNDEIDDLKKIEEKDVYFYLSKISKIFKYVTLIVFLLVSVTFIYVHYQEDPDLKDSSLIDPFCDFILGDIKKDTNYLNCSSIENVSLEKNTQLEKLKTDIFREFISVLPKAYNNESILNSKEILFLIEENKKRLKPLEILNSFDKMKNDFTGEDKEKIKCFNIVITDDNILKANCESFSSDWTTKGILGFDGDKRDNLGKVSGTSISIASSFLNFIEKKSERFTIIDKQKNFTSVDISGDYTGNTKKTSFSLNLEYFNNLK